MDETPFAALRRALGLGARPRREILRLLAATGLGAASLASAASAVARKSKRHRKKRRKRKKRNRKKRKKTFNGDARCQNKGVLSANGTCIDLQSPVEVFPALCAVGCACVFAADGQRTCIEVRPPACQAGCLTGDDCFPGEVCVDLTGCCPSNPAITRSCALPCPAS